MSRDVTRHITDDPEIKNPLKKKLPKRIQLREAKHDAFAL